MPEQPDPATQSVPIIGRHSHLASTGSRGAAATTLKQKERRPKPTPGTIDPYRWFTPRNALTKSGEGGFNQGGGGFPLSKMAGRFQGYHVIRREEVEGYMRFEVFWQNEGWFWRPLLQFDGEAVGPFTTSSQAYQSAVAANDTVVRPRRAS